MTQDFPAVSWTRADGYSLTTDRSRLDLDRIERFLTEEAYWSKGLPRPLLQRALDHSLPFGILAPGGEPGGEMVGFGRLVTDYATFAYLRDVFVLPDHRGRGLSVWLATQIRRHPELATVTTWMLATRDAHAVYAKAGFAPVPHPEYYMSLPKP